MNTLATAYLACAHRPVYLRHWTYREAITHARVTVSTGYCTVCHIDLRRQRRAG